MEFDGDRVTRFDEAFQPGGFEDSGHLGYQACLGSYGYDQQRDIIRIGKTIWQDRLGEDPVNFRPGFFSANDYTYQILCMEGFSQGSCSLPGRVDPEQFSVWRKTCPFAHHTDPLDRKAPGSMEFFEVPVTSDFEATATAPRAETFTPPHLRIEDPYTSQEAEALICKALDRAPADGVGVHTAVFVTHNAVGWGQAEDPHVERLRNLASLLRKVARGRGMVVVPAGLQAVHEQADRRWRAARAPWEGEDFA